MSIAVSTSTINDALDRLTFSRDIWAGATATGDTISESDLELDCDYTTPLRDVIWIPTNTSQGNTPLLRLEEYADASKLREFSQLAEAINWAIYSPEDLLRAIDLALSLELTPLAVRLAQKGQELFPHYERMQHAGHVLAPPVVRQANVSLSQPQSISQQWLREHSEKYQGRWVAVHANILLGVSDTLAGLMSDVNTSGDDSNILITKVL